MTYVQSRGDRGGRLAARLRRPHNVRLAQQNLQPGSIIFVSVDWLGSTEFARSPRIDFARNFAYQAKSLRPGLRSWPATILRIPSCRSQQSACTLPERFRVTIAKLEL